MRAKLIILTTSLLLTSLCYAIASEGNCEEEMLDIISTSEVTQPIVSKKVYKSKKKRKDDTNNKSRKALKKDSITEEDIVLSQISEDEFIGSMNSPSNRINHEWDEGYSNLNAMSIDENESSILEVKEEYMSAIAKIKAAEEEQMLEQKRINWMANISTDDYMEIFISGGGYKSGVDARMHDRIMINNAGYIESYYESEISGVRKTVKTVEKEELAELIRWIAEKGFFDFESEYECYSTDLECKNRLYSRPQPIPLKIVVAVGERRNVVTVPIFSPNIEKKYIEYPKELIQIAEAIYLFASL